MEMKLITRKAIAIKTIKILMVSFSLIPGLFMVGTPLGRSAEATPAVTEEEIRICGIVDDQASGGTACQKPELAIRPTLVYVAEMGFFNTAFRDPWPHSELVSVLDQDQWMKFWKWAQTQIDSAKIKKISRWAQTEMKNYSFNPGKTPPALKIAGRKGGYLLMEATLDTLPSHHPLVTRWLKLFLITEVESPLRKSYVIVTIQGERQE